MIILMIYDIFIFRDADRRAIVRRALISLAIYSSKYADEAQIRFLSFHARDQQAADAFASAFAA